jgi:hypothetical protein
MQKSLVERRTKIQGKQLTVIKGHGAGDFMLPVIRAALQEPVSRFLAQVANLQAFVNAIGISAWRWRAGWSTPLSGATPLAFAGVLAFATVVAGFAAALTLALVLAFACVFALFSISHRLEGDACMARRARCIGTHGEGPS